MRDNFPNPRFAVHSCRTFITFPFFAVEKSSCKVNFHEKKIDTCICREVNVVRTLLPQAAVEEEAAAETTTSPEATAFVKGGAAAPAGVWETCAPESNYSKQNKSAFIFYTPMPIRSTSWVVSAAAAAGGGGLQHCSNPGAVDADANAAAATTLGADVRLRLILMPLPLVSPEVGGAETVPPH